VIRTVVAKRALATYPLQLATALKPPARQAEPCFSTKLQNFVLEALRGLQNKQGTGVEGNCCSAHNLIFVTEAGMPLTQRVVKREFRRLLAKAGIRPVRLYDLRHTAATLGLAAGVSVKVISDLLGHASISLTLERYSHVLPSIQDDAAAKVEKLLVA
jgi:integrase